MKKLVLIALIMMLVGCASSPWVRPAGKTVIEAQNDVYEYNQISSRASQGFYSSYTNRNFGAYGREQSSFKGCMASRGYTKE
jgi:hypothetical protein